ncbi:hypothetical protein [Sodalis ligni]|uniref:hypothetical protein n=1 Tax=Sodalis ligni TaxID=2697027 RepID=UPI002096A6A8|nr:hypothetical protein [Sodalis ligni]
MNSMVFWPVFQKPEGGRACELFCTTELSCRVMVALESRLIALDSPVLIWAVGRTLTMTLSKPGPVPTGVACIDVVLQVMVTPLAAAGLHAANTLSGVMYKLSIIAEAIILKLFLGLILDSVVTLMGSKDGIKCTNSTWFLLRIIIIPYLPFNTMVCLRD